MIQKNAVRTSVYMFMYMKWTFTNQVLVMDKLVCLLFLVNELGQPPKKRVIFLMAVPLRPYPPSSLMAGCRDFYFVQPFFFLIFFFPLWPALPSLLMARPLKKIKIRVQVCLWASPPAQGSGGCARRRLGHYISIHTRDWAKRMGAREILPSPYFIRPCLRHYHRQTCKHRPIKMCKIFPS